MPQAASPGFHLSQRQEQDTDFSVVLLRPTFMLFSEKNYMKVHKNQWLLTVSSPPAILCGGTNQGAHHGVWRADAFAVT